MLPVIMFFARLPKRVRMLRAKRLRIMDVLFFDFSFGVENIFKQDSN
jgi:hypothetical protein